MNAARGRIGGERPATSPAGPWRRVCRPAAAWPLLALVAGCVFFLDKPTVRIVEVRLTSVGITGATARVGLDIVNPNDRDLRAEQVRYRLSFEDDGGDGWRTLAEGETVEEVGVTARDTARVELDLPFAYADVGRAVERLLREGTLRYRFEGDVRFDAPLTDIRVPFDKQGSFSL